MTDYGLILCLPYPAVNVVSVGVQVNVSMCLEVQNLLQLAVKETVVFLRMCPISFCALLGTTKRDIANEAVFLRYKHNYD